MNQVTEIHLFCEVHLHRDENAAKNAKINWNKHGISGRIQATKISRTIQGIQVFRQLLFLELL